MNKLATCFCLAHNGFLTRAGYKVAAAGSPLNMSGVDKFPDFCYLDNRVSVSGARRDGDFFVFDE